MFRGGSRSARAGHGCTILSSARGLPDPSGPVRTRPRWHPSCGGTPHFSRIVRPTRGSVAFRGRSTMAQTPIDPPDIPPDRPPDIAPPVEAPVEPVPSAAVVLPIPAPTPAPAVSGGWLAWGIYALAVANIATLWVVRDVFVNGWDLMGQTYGVLL